MQACHEGLHHRPSWRRTNMGPVLLESVKHEDLQRIYALAASLPVVMVPMREKIQELYLKLISAGWERGILSTSKLTFFDSCCSVPHQSDWLRL